MYDKTVFKPEEIDTLERYKFSLVNQGGAPEQSGATPASTEGSQTSSSGDASAPPSQFDMGDFSDMKPAADPAVSAGEDQLPQLGGPEIEK